MLKLTFFVKLKIYFCLKTKNGGERRGWWVEFFTLLEEIFGKAVMAVEQQKETGNR